MLRLMAVALVLSMATSASAERPKREDPEKSVEPRNKLLCKRFSEIGSLVATKRVCKTKADWDRDRDNFRHSTTTASCGAEGGICR